MVGRKASHEKGEGKESSVKEGLVGSFQNGGEPPLQTGLEKYSFGQIIPDLRRLRNEFRTELIHFALGF